MHDTLLLQFHVHSDRSHDSSTTISEYVEYCEKILKENECVILGITDHNVLPIKIEEAARLSTKKVLVIPGIQWKIRKTLWESLTKLCTRRELLTFGNHDDLEQFIKEKTHYPILPNQEILGRFTEEEFLIYIAANPEIILVIPHPRHFGVDYYGQKEIRDLVDKIHLKKITLPIFIEEKTGYDPFPRIFHSYRNEYLVIGGADAHGITSFCGIKTFFSVRASMPLPPFLKELWEKTAETNNLSLSLYKELMSNIFNQIIKDNRAITIKKYYIKSGLHFLKSIPRWFHRRLDNFPHNVFK